MIQLSRLHSSGTWAQGDSYGGPRSLFSKWSATTVDEKPFLAQLVRNMRASILQARAAMDTEIDELEASVEHGARDPSTVFYQARIHQVSGRRPGDSGRA